MTLDGLLNALDGVQRGASKRIIIATTNYPEKLVPSLRRRGRLGVSFQVTYPDDGVLMRLVRHALPSCDVAATVARLRGVEAKVGIPAPTAALTDVFGKAKLSLKRQQQPAPLPPRQAGQRLATAPPPHKEAAAAASEKAAACAISQVEEVLREVASTNKKVFESMLELLRFLELDGAWTDGDRAASGLAWRRVGGAPPSEPLYGRPPRELQHARLATALAAKAKVADKGAAEVLEFSEEEWKALGVKGLTVERYVRAAAEEGGYYRPVDEDDLAEARPKTYAQAFTDAGCARCATAKHLKEDQLNNEVKIGKVGHRMALIEQFRFL